MLVLIVITNWTFERQAAKNARMKQHIDLPDVLLEKQDDGLLVTHKRTGASVLVSLESLQRWLIRQLRAIFS
jgi:hypothetical protein